MNSIIEIKETDDQKVYFTSDTHFNHNRSFIYESRGYTDVKSYTSAVIDKINERVRTTDILFHLGDFSLNTERDGLNELLSRLVCQNIYYIWGNHNSPLWTVYQDEVKNRLYTKSYTGYSIDHHTGEHIIEGPKHTFTELPVTDVEIYPLRYRNLVFLGNYAEIIIHGHFIVASHYPLVSWNKMKKGAWNLFGHVHGKLNLDGKRVDVGWDNFRKPISFQELQKIMGNKDVISDGSHH